MKTTRQYLTGCTWCGATGFVSTKNFGMGTTPIADTCPVCNGNKTILVTEITEDDWMKELRKMAPKHTWF